MLHEAGTRRRPVRAAFRHPTHPAAIGAVRGEVRAALAPAVPPTVLAQATLLLSELATNAVRHSGSPWFAVSLDIEDGHALRLEVHDDGPGFTGEPEPDFDRAGGYGLQLVDTVADAWGTDVDDGTRVWFTLRW